jgi:hypothetical protein
MEGSKDQIDVFATNIIKQTLEALQADDQQPFDDLARRKEEEVLRQLAEWREGGGRENAYHTSRGDPYGISPTFASGYYYKYFISIF